MREGKEKEKEKKNRRHLVAMRFNSIIAKF